ncbi:MAG: hypothetical protein JWP30_938 [Homoserinimonas sp.]|jgi:hypothetical protein|nr:hypothetical protein [Homoserinimonas sp.]
MKVAIFVTAAAASYTANCMLGVAVATRALDTRTVHWIHHTLYVCTVAVTGASILAGARMLLPAIVPLSVIPFVGAGTPRHPIVALAAAPFFIAAFVRAWR